MGDLPVGSLQAEDVHNWPSDRRIYLLFLLSLFLFFSFFFQTMGDDTSQITQHWWKDAQKMCLASA